jgi:hypothetical protein
MRYINYEIIFSENFKMSLTVVKIETDNADRILNLRKKIVSLAARFVPLSKIVS